MPLLTAYLVRGEFQPISIMSAELVFAKFIVHNDLVRADLVRDLLEEKVVGLTARFVKISSHTNDARIEIAIASTGKRDSCRYAADTSR